MTKNDEPRPRSRRTKKEKEMVVEEAASIDGSPDVLQLENVASDGKTSEADASEFWNYPSCRFVAPLSFR